MTAWHGYGRLLYNKFGSYEGKFSQNCFYGKGKFIDFVTGEVKEGIFKNTKEDMNKLFKKLYPQMLKQKQMKDNEARVKQESENDKDLKSKIGEIRTDNELKGNATDTPQMIA